MNIIQENIDKILQSSVGDVRYASLKNYLSNTQAFSPKEFSQALDINYLVKKIEENEDLLTLSLLYKTFLSLSSKENFSFYSLEYEKQTIRNTVKSRLKTFASQKQLKTLCFCDILKEKCGFPMEILKKTRENIKIIYLDLFEPLFSSDFSGFSFMSKIFFLWGLILDSSFHREEVLLVIDIMNLALNPRLYQYSSFYWGYDFSKLWGLIKTVLKIASKAQEKQLPFHAELNLQVFFEVFPEANIKNTIRECWDKIKNFIDIDVKEDIFCNAWKKIISLAFTKKTLLFFYEISKHLLKNHCFHTLWRFYKEIVLVSLLDKLRGNVFNEVLEILKMYIFGFLRKYMLSKEEWSLLQGNFRFLATKSKENEKQIKEFHEVLFVLTRCYTLFYAKENNNQVFSKKTQIDQFLQKIKRSYSMTDPSQYLIELNYEKLMLSDKELENIPMNLEVAPKDQQILQRDFAPLENTGLICYMNSFIQSLYVTTPFRKHIFDAVNLDKLEEDPKKMLYNLQVLFTQMKANSTVPKPEKINPTFFKNTLPEPFCISHDQQDAMEFGRILLEDIEKKAKEIPLGKLIKELFTVEIVHRYHCQECGQSSVNSEESIHISLSFGQEIKRRFDFKDLMKKNIQDERLEGENEYDCEKCNRKSKLTIKTSRWKRLPPVLIIIANRFSNKKNKSLFQIDIPEHFSIEEIFSKDNFETNQPIKNLLSTEMEVEEEKGEVLKENAGKMDLENEKEIEKEPILEEKNEPNWLKRHYSLYCMIIHKGYYIEQGHYFTLAKDFQDGAWFRLDDLQPDISKIDNDQEDVASDETPYVFYYIQNSSIIN